jgi:hypothetical protein
MAPEIQKDYIDCVTGRITSDAVYCRDINPLKRLNYEGKIDLVDIQEAPDCPHFDHKGERQ